ncbi:MAG: beta-ketoacyl-[acyl-carrier-protein] synthase I [unclassified Hahellaceae]|nr:beta-ketoacyl-[acyl-carrier-protein] synthase I [Hahellaceae bacterium]|tara:strand:- start:120079 stop:121368 length:1290 start_codon:yes stop_codon:yes gene_type:complete
MRRVVVTGIGIVSSLGSNQTEVHHSLAECRSGIGANAGHIENGLRSHISGQIDIDFAAHVDRKLLRFMGDASVYSYIAMKEAIAQAGLTPAEVSNERTGLIMGAGGASTENVMDAIDILRDKGIRKVGPYRVTRTMNSSVNANLATPFAIRGVNYSITSACATSAHCIGAAAQQIQFGLQDVMFAGGAEDCHWTLSCLFDAMGALSTGYNDRPKEASRPYDADRDGFVISGGAGVLVLESLERAQARGATILAELTGFGATSDGDDMVVPSGEGAARCMLEAVRQANAIHKRPVDYINAHGTSTKVGDIAELKAIRAAFGGEGADASMAKIPAISSTKAISGHGLGAAGVQEAIYGLLMMRNRFLVRSDNLQTVDDAVAEFPILREMQYDIDVNRILSNSFGFGGTNACLVFDNWSGVHREKAAMEGLS